MGLLDSFEKGLERAVNGAFAKTFRSGIQPVEIASALRREMDTRAAVVSRERILAPNSYAVRLSTADADRMRTLGPSLYDELRAIVQKHASSQGYSFSGPLVIDVQSSDQVPTGTIDVTSSAVEGRVSWQAVLDINGRRHSIVRARTVIGRGSDADITISDAGTSRRHVEVLWDGERGMVRDLGSTNGSRLDGQRVERAGLADGQTITIGRTDIVFRVIASASAQAARLPGGDDATQIINEFHGGRR
ncbi:MAG: FhaA domain-containing protein [Microbacterium gubbeenense]